MQYRFFHPPYLLNIQCAKRCICEQTSKSGFEKMLLKNSCRNVNVFIANMYEVAWIRNSRSTTVAAVTSKCHSSGLQTATWNSWVSVSVQKPDHHSITLPDLASCNGTLVHLTALSQRETKLEMHFSRSWPFWRTSEEHGKERGQNVTNPADCLKHWFSNWGPWTPGGPPNSTRGSHIEILEHYFLTINFTCM